MEERHPSGVKMERSGVKGWQGCTHPDVEVVISVPRADAEGVVGPGVDAGGLHVEDVRWDQTLRHHAHVAMHDGERQLPATGLDDGADTAAAEGPEYPDSSMRCQPVWQQGCRAAKLFRGPGLPPTTSPQGRLPQYAQLAVFYQQILQNLFMFSACLCGTIGHSALSLFPVRRNHRHVHQPTAHTTLSLVVMGARTSFCNQIRRLF